MKFSVSSRLLARTAAFTGVAAFLGAGIAAQDRLHRNLPPPVIERRAPAPQQAHPQVPAASTLAPIQRHQNPGQKPTGEHLPGWLDHHSNLTPAQQQQALEKEPGFHELPSQTQQRMRERLTQLDNMTPEQRAKLLAHTEAMERLSPEQRGQVRNTMQQLAALPLASRKAVQRTFRNLRDMSPAQRDAYLNSPDIRSQFTDQERGALTSLMAVEPYLPRTANEPNPNP